LNKAKYTSTSFKSNDSISEAFPLCLFDEAIKARVKTKMILQYSCGYRITQRKSEENKLSRSEKNLIVLIRMRRLYMAIIIPSLEEKMHASFR